VGRDRGLSIEGNAAVIAGLRAMAELAEANGDLTYAKTCREAATTIDSQFDANQYTTSGIYGDHEYYITAKNPTWNPEAEKRPDAASFMVYYPWNVRNANEMHILESLDDTNVYTASYTSCLGRYPKDKYTPSESIEDGGWPLCEAYADSKMLPHGLLLPRYFPKGWMLTVIQDGIHPFCGVMRCIS